MQEVFVGNIPLTTTNADIERLFEIVDAPTHIRINKRFAFVGLRDQATAEAAVSKLHGAPFLGETLRVELGKVPPRNAQSQGSNPVSRRPDRRPESRFDSRRDRDEGRWRSSRSDHGPRGSSPFRSRHDRPHSPPRYHPFHLSRDADYYPPRVPSQLPYTSSVPRYYSQDPSRKFPVDTFGEPNRYYRSPSPSAYLGQRAYYGGAGDGYDANRNYRR